ncbi:MAG: hypothetical protein QOJ29_1499 [Thermoleophilaceae bacterium]|nr:hypothetical protein [Thermoleophilaceae bacterium]
MNALRGWLRHARTRRGRLLGVLAAAPAVWLAITVVAPALGASAAPHRPRSSTARHEHRGGPGKRHETGGVAASAGSDPAGQEVVGRRTATSRTWKTGDGRFHTRVYASPVNYRDSRGGWRAIDDTLVADPSAGYAFQNRADSYRVQVPNQIADRPITVHAGRDSVGFRLLGANGNPRASDSTATFKDVLPGVSAAYTAGPSLVKESLTLADASAPASYTYALDLGKGLSANENDRGGIDVAGSDGSVRFSFEAPFATDHAGTRIESGHGIS